MAVMQDVGIRLLRPEDAPRVADLLAEAFAEEFEGAGTEVQAVVRQLRSGGWAQRGPLHRLAALVGIEFAFFVALYHGRVIGCAGIMGRRLPVINSVAVLPEFRRRGIAETLVRTAETFAAEHGHEAVVLDVLAHNTPAHTLYVKLGYEEYHRYRAYVRADLPPQTPSLQQTASRAVSLLPEGIARSMRSHDVPAAALPPGYRLEHLRRQTAAAFATVEREALPDRFRAVTPSLRPRYTGGAPALIEWLVGNARSYRRVVMCHDSVAGYLAAHLGVGLREGRIEYPLLSPRHTPALPGVLAGATAFIAASGGTSARVDISADRPDQCAAAEAEGFAHRWTFVQMVKRLTRGARIPVRAGARARANGH